MAKLLFEFVCFIAVLVNASESLEPTTDSVKVTPFTIYHSPNVLENSEALLDPQSNVAVFKIQGLKSCFVLKDLSLNPDLGEYKAFNISSNGNAANDIGQNATEFCKHYKIHQLTELPEDNPLGDDSDESSDQAGKQLIVEHLTTRDKRCNGYNGYPYNYGYPRGYGNYYYGGYPYYYNRGGVGYGRDQANNNGVGGGYNNDGAPVGATGGAGGYTGPGPVPLATNGYGPGGPGYAGGPGQGTGYAGPGTAGYTGPGTAGYAGPGTAGYTGPGVVATGGTGYTGGTGGGYAGNVGGGGGGY